MSINLSALMKQRYDTAANWTAQNPTLLAGEIGIESDTKKWKVGTGATAWTSLVYAIGGTYPLVNADIAAGAAIAYSKLATLTSGNVVLGSAANVATSTAVTGDVTISNTGVTAIAAGVIVNADIAAGAAIAGTKISPDFGSQNTTTTGTSTAASFIPTSSSVPTNGFYLPATNSVAISTGGTVKATVDSSGRLLVGVSANANGGILQLSSGITFPATAVAASNVNTLDDYEEGTWTAGIAFAGGTTGITYNLQTGVYTKIGRMVTCIGVVYLSSKGSSSGVVTITGLPFTVAAGEPNYSGVSFGYIANMTFASVLFARTVAGSTTLTLAEVTTAGVDTDITNADFTNTTLLRFTVTYFV